MAGQFGTMDTLGDRKEVMGLCKRIGRGLPDQQAAEARARVLADLVKQSTTCFGDKKILVSPCSPVDAYLLWGAITGCLGVPAEQAARTLEAVARGKG